MSVLSAERLSEIESLLPYANTPRRVEIIQEVLKTSSITQAARHLGIDKTTVRESLNWTRLQAVRRGWEPADVQVGTAPPGYMIRGKSTLVGRDGKPVLQWVKTNVDWDTQYQALEAAIADLFSEVPPRRPLKRLPTNAAEDLLALYPEGDPHWGMRVWGPETDGTDYDLTIALREYHAAVDWLVDQAPKTKEAIALNVGDNFHADNHDAVTPRAGNRLHTDSRLGKVFQTVLEARVYKIDRMLRKHERVIVREVYGNHDPVLCLGFTKALIAYYRNEPRVEVVDSPNAWWHHLFGKVMLGTTHGDRCKIKDMPLLMATDAPEYWAAAKHRHCYTGHQHHLERWEEPGCTVEMLRTLAARNEYEHMAGYRSGREMMCRIFHREYGEVVTHRLGIDLIHALIAEEHGGKKKTKT